MIKALFLKALRALSVKRVLLGLLILVAVVGSGSSIYFYKKYSAIKANPNAEAQKETTALVATLSKHIQLPTDEQPSVVTITDKTKLADQPFFKMAENGDILFAYVNTKEAILYRPSIDKIIQVASINVGEAAADQGVAAQITVAYYNGTTTTGLSAEAEKAVKAVYSTFKTASLTSASKTDYPKTVVVDISGQHSAEADQIAQLLNGVVSTLPAGETAPEADLLVISGK